MSGYLQRLVHTVAQPGGSVHPRTGSIFSPYREEPGPPEAPLSPAAVHIPEPAQSERASSVEVPILADSIVSAVAPTAQLSAQLTPARPPSGRRSELAPEEQSGEVPQNRIALTTKFSANAPAPGADRPYRALMKPIAEARKDNALPRDMRPERHVERVERQPDDIQVHIGRIEVTAVPPPLPRTPKLPDRALSLDAYLSRREGRAR
jgi:hypothetical protein